MTQDEIIELAFQGHASTRAAIRWAINQEREACVKIINDSYDTTTPGEGIPEDWLLTLVELIQARGKSEIRQKS